MARSTLYYHVKIMGRAEKYQNIMEQITSIYQHHKGRYGYRRITLALRRCGYLINHKTVQRLMGNMSLMAAIRVKKYRSWKGQVGVVAPNILRRDFRAEKPNEKWVTDVTEFAVNGEKLYLSPLLDVFNGEVISYSLSEKPVMGLVHTMLEKAFLKLNPGDTPVLHSDQGWQYQMAAYQGKLKAHGVLQSMSRKGNCLDNAMAESFFSTLKSECFYLAKYGSINELKTDIDNYIHYYNHERISLRLKGLSPVEYRTQALMTA